jgi:pancreatic triacylglycerol lipase
VIYFETLGAQTVNYIAARNRVEETGIVVAQFINMLITVGGMDINRLSIVGHRFAGKNTQGRINTIFGTDPAGPLFSMNSPEERLAATDAQYVETILTNGGTLGGCGFLS